MQTIHQRALPFYAALDKEFGTTLTVKNPIDEFLQRLRQRRVLTPRFVVYLRQPRR